MAADAVPYFRPQFFDLNGNPLAGGKIYTYKAGTTTPLVTYKDAGFTQNTNPIILDSSGCADIFIGLQPVKFIIKDANDVLLKTVDNVTGPNGTSVGIQTVVEITTDGTETEFDLGVDPEVVQNCTVVIKPTSGDSRVYLTSEYSVDGQTLTFDSAPPAGTGEIRIGATRAISASGLSDGIVTTAKIQDLAVTVAKIADNSINTAKIQNDAVTTAKIIDAAVTTAKINDSAVTTAKINDGAITAAKFAVLPKLKFENFTASTNGTTIPHWTCPAGVTSVLVTGIGGGGGGGAGSSFDSGVITYYSGGGGGGGVLKTVAVSVTPGTSYEITIGGGGAGATTAGGTGSNGVESKFSTLVSFPGGFGGRGSGGTGGTGGSTGESGRTVSGSTTAGGRGGSGLVSGGAGGTGSTAGSNASANSGAGGGGGSGSSNTTNDNGGNGGSGWLQIAWVENQ